MSRYRLTLEYDGTGFVGWQRQANGLSVQQAVEEAIFAFTGERPGVIAAGRTDSGVHALAMTAHADIARDMPAKQIRDALNAGLRPHPVVVVAVRPVADDFNARFDCLRRRYLYRILNRPTRPAIDQGRVWHIIRPLDVKAMAEAATHLIGRHDFESFRASHCQAASAVKTLDMLTVTALGEEIHIRCAARSFLHNQVRIIAGTLAETGEGKRKPAQIIEALAARDRSAAGATAPARGLYFISAEYPDDPPVSA